MERKIKLSIVMPAYNEEKRIERTIEKYVLFFKKNKPRNLNFEILIVLNACRDKTLDVVKRLQKRFKELKYLNFKRGGKGFAITEGFKDAINRDVDLIGFVDADMATPPNAFYDLLIKLINENSNIHGVIASRWMKQSEISIKQTFLRRFVSRGFNFIIKTILLLPYKDTQCGAKLFKKEVLVNFVKKQNTAEWAFDVDLLYHLKKKGFIVKEIPTTWEDKKGSKLNLIKVPFQMFSSIIRIRLINSPFNCIVRVYDKLPENKKIHNW